MASVLLKHVYKVYEHSKSEKKKIESNKNFSIDIKPRKKKQGANLKALQQFLG